MKKENQIYGQELILDLYDCDPVIVRSEKKLQSFVDQLCKIIRMKKFGKTFLGRFGFNKSHTAGYSLVQLIESSSIIGHFSELWNSVYLNIFSCQPFDIQKATKFTKEFFKAKRIKKKVIKRV
jgi:S-adenosylmethionine/arginine decarboxylase-like enzyme